MKKIKVKKNIKLGLLIPLIILSLLSFYQFAVQIFMESYTEITQSVYTYQSTSSIDYNMSVKSNPLFDNEILEKNQIYITQYVNALLAVLDYTYVGSEVSNISGNYKIIAQVEGYISKENSVIPIWQKDFILLPDSSFEDKSDTITIHKDVALSIYDYQLYAKRIIEETKINTPVRLKLIMDVQVTSDTKHGKVEEKHQPYISIPLNTSYFEITGNPLEDINNTIDKTSTMKKPINKRLIIIWSILLGLGLVGLLFIIIFVKVHVEHDRQYETLKKIFQKHGDSLVAVKTEIGIHNEYTYFVQSFEDLISLSDTLNQPILYTYHSEFCMMTKFYIFHDDRAFIYYVE